MSLVSVAPSDHVFKAIRKAQEKFVSRDARLSVVEGHISTVLENNARLKSEADLSNEVSDRLDRMASLLESFPMPT